MNLKEMKPGKNYKLENVPDSLATDFLRLGLCIGDKIKCVCRIPKGPVILQKVREMTQIAVGESDASKVMVCSY